MQQRTGGLALVQQLAQRHEASVFAINLTGMNIDSLEPLRSCKSLSVLDISMTPVQDLSPLDDLPDLARLTLSLPTLTPKLRARQAAGKLTVTTVR